MLTVIQFSILNICHIHIDGILSHIFNKIFKAYTTLLAYDFAMEVEKGNPSNHEPERICKKHKTF